ncbi:MarR family transcriptional regulator, partial [Streptomyces rubiginosohelvolus]
VGLLMDQGLITRRAHPTDGRKSLVELSEAGRALLEEERDRRADWLARAIDAELSEEERALLARAIGLVGRLAAH